MPRFLACRTEVRFDDGSPAFVDDDADVEIDDGRILLCYFDDCGAVVLQGREKEPGRFELVARSRPRKARLTRNEGVLEGTWYEGDSTGSLRVVLAEREQS